MSAIYEYSHGKMIELFPDEGFTAISFIAVSLILSLLSMFLAQCAQWFAEMFWDEITNIKDKSKLKNNPKRNVTLSWASNHISSATIGAG
jgi:hypothetical protein